MKKTNFTFLKWQKETFLPFLMIMVLSMIGSNVHAQCSLGCNGTINVGLDNLICQAEITPAMMLNDQMTTCPGGIYEVIVSEPNGTVIPTSPIVTADYIGWTLTVSVRDINSTNSCWGYALIEDKMPPIIECPVAPNDTITMPCYNVADYFPVITDNCDTHPDTILLNEYVDANDCNGIYPDSVLKVVTRVYQAIDDYGNVSNICTIHIRVVRLDSLNAPLVNCPESIQLPNALECDGVYPVITDGPYAGHPHPSYTGAPFLDQDGDLLTIDDQTLLWPDPDLYCNILVVFTDLELPPIGCVAKIMRTWNIIEWSCENPQRSRVCVQIIEIVDEDGPEFDCPDDMTVTTNVFGDYNSPIHGPVTCAANVWLPPVSPVDACDNNPIHVDITYPGGILTNQNGGYAELPLGVNIVTYTVYDGCYNSTYCSFEVLVEDNTPPTPVCDQHTAVSVSTNGVAYVYASTFDDGSYDDCAIDCIVARRMTPEPCECEVPYFGGFDYMGEYNGHHYYLSHLPYDRLVAQRKAQALGGTMAITRSGAEFNWVHTEVQDIFSSDAYWLGVERVNSANNNSGFRWLNGQTISYSNWAAGEPNNAGGIEDCVEVMPNGEWSDVPSSERMRFVLELDDICGFSDYVPFCCEDIGDEDVMVVFRVIDVFGNYNDCMVSVEVQDKLPPVITCPPDETVSCDSDFDLDHLSDYFGEATAVDNCNVIIDETNDPDFNQCNIGTITRTFTATDPGGRTDVCEQVITFVNYDPFDEDDIQWPSDVNLEGCADPTTGNFHPDFTGWPIFHEDECDLVGANWDDQYFPFNNTNGDACFKILRTWQVIDWCQFVNGQLPYNQPFQYIQIIKVNNTVDPTFEGDPCQPKSVCTFDPSCSGGFIELIAEATDDCTDLLDWSAEIDINDDGSFDNAYYRSGTDTIADASGVYPVGWHSVLWTFEDKCGNKISCEQPFHIFNCKAPTPYLINGLAVDLMPVDTDNDNIPDWGMVEIWANDFDQGSSHACGYDVVLSFSEDWTDTGMIFDCNTLGEQSVSIYVTVVDENGDPLLLPDGSILQAWAETFIDVQDNMEVCPEGGGMLVNIQGRIATEEDMVVDNVEVELLGSELNKEMSDLDGLYAFPEMATGGEYTVDPTRDIDDIAGVSTLDLLLIQKQILGLDDLDSPYKMIAADVNNDDNITAIDLIELRKLILGVYDKFPSNESWRFVDKGFDFGGQSPFDVDFPEVYEIDNFSSDMNIDFVAVKTGDVNNSVTSNLQGNDVGFRNAGVDLITRENVYAAEETIRVEFTFSRNTDLAGFQMTVQFDARNMEFVTIESDVLDISESNTGLASLDRGYLTMSWNTGTSKAVTTGETVMTAVFIAKKSGILSESIAVNSDITSAELYTGNLEEVELGLEIRNLEAPEFVLFQNTPNPFSATTSIRFSLPQASLATITVTDVAGKTLSIIKGDYSTGMNEVMIDRDDLNVTGVLYYTLETESYTATRKMVVVR